jgi:hypothetical protein
VADAVILYSPKRRGMSKILRTASDYEIKQAKLPKLLFVGSSYHASVVLDAIELSEAYLVGCYLDDTKAQVPYAGITRS